MGLIQSECVGHATRLLHSKVNVTTPFVFVLGVQLVIMLQGNRVSRVLREAGSLEKVGI